MLDSDLDLVRLPDHQIPAVGPGDRAPDQEQVVVLVDPDDLEILDGDPRVAELARLADPLAGVGRVGARARRARVAVHPLDAVARPQSLEAVSLHDTGKATAFA